MPAKEILSFTKIKHIARRVAYEVWEQNYDTEQLILAGIAPRGTLLRDILHDALKDVACDISIKTVDVALEKDAPLSQKIKIHGSTEEIDEKSTVLLIDDVLYTGKTMAYATMPFLEKNIFKMQVFVLVYRDFLRFPVKPDFVGLSLATTTKQHVSVKFENDGVIAELN